MKITRKLVMEAGHAMYTTAAWAEFDRALKATRTSTLDILADRYDDAAVEGSQDADELANRLATTAQAVASHVYETYEAPAPKAPRDPKPNWCQCGCGANVAKRYKQGHDAKHKADLIRRALGTDVEAAEHAVYILNMKGWSHFLEAARHPKGRKPRTARVEGDHAAAVETVSNLEAMKLVAKALKAAGRDEQVTKENVDSLASELGLAGPD